MLRRKSLRRSRCAGNGAGLILLVFLAGALPLARAAEEQKTTTGLGPAAWTGDLTPITPADWNEARAAHLLERAGFGGTPKDIAHFAKMTPQEAVHTLVHYKEIAPVALPPLDESGIFPSKDF